MSKFIALHSAINNQEILFNADKIVSIYVTQFRGKDCVLVSLGYPECDYYVVEPYEEVKKMLMGDGSDG